MMIEIVTFGMLICGIALGYIIGSQTGYTKGFDDGLRTRVSFELLSQEEEE